MAGWSLVRQIILSNRFVGELYEMVDVMIGVYAKLHGSMFLYLSVKSMCVNDVHIFSFLAEATH